MRLVILILQDFNAQMTASFMHFLLFPIIFVYVYFSILYAGGLTEIDFGQLDESG